MNRLTLSSVHLPFQVHLGRRAKIAVRYGGYTLFSLVVFLLGLQLVFPYERLRDRLVDAVAANYELQIGDVERGLIPGRVYFNNVSVRGRATKPDEVVAPLFIRRLQVDVGLFAIVRRAASVDFDAAIGDAKNGVGHVTGNVTLAKFGKAGIEVDIDGQDLPGVSLPLRSVVGLPILGTIDFVFKLDLPTVANKASRGGFDWRKAEGIVELSCGSRCTIGDGRTKLKPLLQDRTNQVMVADGIDFGKLDVDSLVARGVFTPEVGNPDARSSNYKPGKFEIQKFELKSPDGELHVDYEMTLAQEIGESMVAGCLRYKASERLLQKEETKRTYAAISTIGAELRGDGLFHVRLTERLKGMKRLNQECGPNAKGITRGSDSRPRPSGTARPGLASTDNTTSQPVDPGSGGTPTPTPTPLPPPPPPSPPTAPPPGGIVPPNAVPGMGGAPGAPGSATSGTSAPGTVSPGAVAPGGAPAPGTGGAPGASGAPETAAPGTPGSVGSPGASDTQGSQAPDYPMR